MQHTDITYLPEFQTFGVYLLIEIHDNFHISLNMFAIKVSGNKPNMGKRRECARYKLYYYLLYIA